MFKVLLNVIIAIMIITVSGAIAGTTVVQDTINEINTQYSYRYGKVQGYATNVDYWYLSVDTTRTVSIDILSWYHDFDDDGFSYCFDSVIYLFADDGELSSDDLIIENDDASGGNGFFDGSTDTKDSYWNGTLEEGNYILSISDYHFYLEDAIDGVNNYGYAPIKVDLSDESTTWESDEGNLGAITYADYQITFEGFDRVSSSPVPVPNTCILLGAGFLGLVFISSRHRQRGRYI